MGCSCHPYLDGRGQVVDLDGRGGGGVDGVQHLCTTGGVEAGGGRRGRHGTIGRWDGCHLPLEQLQDHIDVCSHPRFQPGTEADREGDVNTEWERDF